MLEFLLLGMNLVGDLHYSTSHNTNLTILEFYFLSGSNQITGTIPTELGLLTSLQWLDLSNNQLTGTLPEEVKQLDGTTIDYGKFISSNYFPSFNHIIVLYQKDKSR